MNFDDYQAKALATAIFPTEMAIPYLALGLTNEAGEVAGKIKKIIRDQNGAYSDETRRAVILEIGDTIWYAAVLAAYLNFNLDDVVEMNLEKLASRAQRDKIGGSGDER